MIVKNSYFLCCDFKLYYKKSLSLLLMMFCIIYDILYENLITIQLLQFRILTQNIYKQKTRLAKINRYTTNHDFFCLFKGTYLILILLQL